MADPFRPTVEDLTSMTTGQPGYDMVSRGFGMGADPIAKPPITGGNPFQGGIPWWMMPLAAAAGMRGMRQVAPQMPRPANQNMNPQNPYPSLAVPKAMSRGGDPAQSQVGQLNQLNEQQFQVYMDARSRGMSVQDAMAAARR